MATTRSCEAALERLTVSGYTIPTDAPEADGTISWNKTTMVLVEATAAGKTGLGYTYGSLAAARLIADALSGAIQGHDVFNIPGAWQAMVRCIRNDGRPGIGSMAVSAVDCALWDLKARLLDMPLVKLLGGAHDSVPAYGSGGFTSYSIGQLQKQLSGWVAQGIPRVKMKIGSQPEQDLPRVRAARQAIGDRAELYVDANGAYSRKQALAQAEAFAQQGVSWFEEPVSSDDLEGLRLIRDRAPAIMDIAAGEYGYDVRYFRHMLAAGAVDVLQADITRCGGVTGFMQVAALCSAHCMELSPHCSPAQHVHPACAVGPLHHLEYFHDHVRIENMFFDGVVHPVEGALHPDLSRPGTGLEFKRADAGKYIVWGSADAPDR